MAITVDARTSSTRSLGGSVANAASVSWTHPYGSTVTNGILLAMGGQDANANSSKGSWDAGVAGSSAVMTRKGGSNPTGNCRAECFFILSPAVTGTKTITIGWTGVNDGGFGSASYCGVDQTTPFNAASPQTSTGVNGTNPSLSVTSSVGGLAVDAFVQDFTANSSTPTVGPGQNYIAAGVASVGSIGVGTSDEFSVGASVAMTWTVDTTKGNWAQVGIALVEAAGGAAATLLNPFKFTFMGVQ